LGTTKSERNIIVKRVHYKANSRKTIIGGGGADFVGV